MFACFYCISTTIPFWQNVFILRSQYITQTNPSHSSWHPVADVSANHWLGEVEWLWPDNAWRICEFESTSQRELACCCNVRLLVCVLIKSTQFFAAKPHKLWKGLIGRMWLGRWKGEPQHCCPSFGAALKPERPESTQTVQLGWSLLSCVGGGVTIIGSVNWTQSSEDCTGAIITVSVKRWERVGGLVLHCYAGYLSWRRARFW